ncbi:hypothetical protein, partial [Streptomyces scabiei]|uniref:hypothetical protein n=1 Tax=Streptomyces scabiei TaxID=1930 RepID=UPI001F30F3F5
MHEHGSTSCLHPPAPTGPAPPVHTAGPRADGHATGRTAEHSAPASVEGTRVRRPGHGHESVGPGHLRPDRTSAGHDHARVRLRL